MKGRTKMIITFGNFKGGVGKTTTTILFAYLLADKGYKVLAIDTDPQESLSNDLLKTYNFDINAEKNVYNALLSDEDNSFVTHIQPVAENLDLLSGSWDMVKFDVEINKLYLQEALPYVLSRKLKAVEDEYDYILIDMHPATNITMENAIMASDHILVPTQTTETAYTSTQKFYDFLYSRSILDEYKFNFLGILPYLVGRGSADQYALAEYIEVFEDDLFKNHIRNSDRVKTWSRTGITADNPHDQATLSMYDKVVEEAIERMKG